MKINVVFPYNTLSGAHRSTFELANRMAARGHSVAIYFPLFPSLEGNNLVSRKGISLLIRGLGRSIARWNRVPWFDLKVPVHMVPFLSDRFIRNADIIMANHRQTAYSVARLSPSKGLKFNFVRHAYVDGSNPWETQSFRLPLRLIVSLPWLKEHLEKNVGVPVLGIVSNGINMEDFGVEEKPHNEAPIVTMNYGPKNPRKGTEDGLKVLEAVLKKHPKVQIQLFGWQKPKNGLPFTYTFHYRPVKERLKEVYARTDIFLASSRSEGYHNPPREAMAAKCAVVATNVGSIPHCALPGETALVVEAGDIDGMTQGVNWLIENPQKRHEMGLKAHNHIKKFDWEESTSKLLEIFLNA